MEYLKFFKKYDKFRSQITKPFFYNMISKQELYRYYIKQTQRFNANIQLVVFGQNGVLIQRKNMFMNLVIDIIYRLENIFPDLCKSCERFFLYMELSRY